MTAPKSPTGTEEKFDKNKVSPVPYMIKVTNGFHQKIASVRLYSVVSGYNSNVETADELF